MSADRTSPRQVDANRRNASKSTGPKTEAGKARSRRNGLIHGLAAEALVPEANGADLQSALERWGREAGPSNVVEEHLVKRAAVGSVTLDRITEAREDTRAEASREALRDWERSKQHAARRRGQDLDKDPVGVVDDLQTTAFGCDWLIRQWERLDAPLRLGGPWDAKALGRAQLLLGLPEGTPGIDAEAEVRAPWLLAAAIDPAKVAPLPRTPDERDLPTDPIPARAALRRFIAEQIDHLLDLRDDAWDRVEGPEARAVARRHAAADTSRDGQIRHRYATAADRSCNAAVRLYLNLRDRRRRELAMIAREARQTHNPVPRAPVGGGWWREVDSDPAPPGFRPIPPAEADAPTPPYANCTSAYVEPTRPTPEACAPPSDPALDPHPSAPSPAEPAPVPHAELLGSPTVQDPESPASLRGPRPDPSIPHPGAEDGPRPPRSSPTPERRDHPCPAEPALASQASAAADPSFPPVRPDDPPRRSEPISPLEPQATYSHNPLTKKDLKRRHPLEASGAPRRTLPLPPRPSPDDRPAHPRRPERPRRHP